MHMSMWAARLLWHALQGQESSGGLRRYIGTIFLCAAVLASSLEVGGVKQNSGPGVEDRSIMQVLCNGCDHNLKLGNAT